MFRATSARQDATGMDITSRCTLGDPNKLPEGVPQPARMPYVSDKHPRQTLEVINLLRKHRELCDVVLVVGAKKIYAHRVILSACSPYFRYKHCIQLTSGKGKYIWDWFHWPTNYHQCSWSTPSKISWFPCSLQGDVHWRAGREQTDRSGYPWHRWESHGAAHWLCLHFTGKNSSSAQCFINIWLWDWWSVVRLSYQNFKNFDTILI